MGFGESVKQDNTIKKEIPKIEKKENNFLDSNLDIKKIGENIKSQYPSFDIDNFGNFVQKLLEDNNIKKEYLNKYLENILMEYLDTNENFIFDSNDYDLLYRIKSEINKDKNIENKDKNINNKDSVIIKNIQTLSSLYQSIPDSFKPENEKNKEDFDKFTKFNLTLEIRSKLENAGIPIDEYLIHRYTAQQLSKSGDIIPNKYEFIKSFNQLNKLLDIDIQIPLVPDKIVNYKPLPDSLDDFQTKPEKILALDSVKDYIDSSPDILMDKDIFNYNKNFIKVFFSSLLKLIKDSK